MTIDLL
jgi:hypothetical protein